MIKFATLVVTFFYFGKIKFCPGTIGSFLALIICYFIAYIMIDKHINIFILINFKNQYTLHEQYILSIFITYLLMCVCLLIFSIYLIHIYITEYNIPDPPEIIIDEVVGQILTFALSMFGNNFIAHSQSLLANNIYTAFVSLIPFILFRIYDICKPWPIDVIEQRLSGIGYVGAVSVMLDDIIAAILATITYYVILFKFI